MIRIQNDVLIEKKPFWNGCVFHPTDAVEDPWGRRILDKMADDGAVKTVRIYAMLEDIVYMDENGALCYDFRLSDLRLDYLVEKGYDLVLSYAGMPDCIARSTGNKTSVSKNKTRYKGKMWNSAPPKDASLWEEVCYEYTRHNVERYGIERVSNWHCHCFNEPDIGMFFMSDLVDDVDNLTVRCREYCKMYEEFERGVRRVSDMIPIGGPALAGRTDFLGGFLDYVKENDLKLDYIALHHYGTDPASLNDGTRPFMVSNNLEKHQSLMKTIIEHGFEKTPVIVDEWGMASAGFYNKEECPALIAREGEVFSSYFVKLIHSFIHYGYDVDGLMICLSGQHEMLEDFSGFRNFFTLNFIKKPIYNAFVMSSRLGEKILKCEEDRSDLFVIPTRLDSGKMSVLLTYSADEFEDDIPTVEETVCFDEDVSDKTVIIWCIDRENTNPYRLFEKMGKDTLDKGDIERLREEGIMKPIAVQSGRDPIVLKLTPNCTYLVEVE